MRLYFFGGLWLGFLLKYYLDLTCPRFIGSLLFLRVFGVWNPTYDDNNNDNIPVTIQQPHSTSPHPPDSIAWGKQGESDSLKQAQKSAWFAAFDSQLQAFNYEITDIEGAVPAGLLGSTLFRNGPSRFERGDQRVSHYLDGDGYLAKIAFSPTGKVYFSSRFVETAEYTAESAANAFRFRTTFGNPQSPNPFEHLFDLHLKNPANTHIVPWGDKLLALYEAGAPYRIDPHSLKTLGMEDLAGNLQTPPPLPANRLASLMGRAQGQQAMTAHPHVDPVNQRLVTWTWGVEAKLAQPNTLVIELSEYDSAWQCLSRKTHKMPGASVNPHDFALTPNYYVFFENALSLDILPYLFGQKSPADCLTLSERATKMHLIPRPLGQKSAAAPLVLETEQWFSIHQACAWEDEDGWVEVYSSGWPATRGGFLTSWGGYAPDFDAIAPTYLWQTRIHPVEKRVIHRLAPGSENCCVAHPHSNPQQETRPCQYLYMAYCNTIGDSSPPTGYLKLDTQTQQRQIWRSHPLNFAEEPLFVSDPSGTNEDDGWLLCIMYDHLKGRSALNIFDARQLEHGPICRLWFTHRLAHGLHGSWQNRYYGPLGA
jgi:all-trans-8'-apo-beta-carotenal 15,15'-oxygenase